MAKQNKINNKANDIVIDNLKLTDNEIQSTSGDLILATDGTNNIKLKVNATTYADFFSSGAVNLPLQPSFFVYANANVLNQTGAGTEITVALNTEIYDITNNFSSNTFTAPVTGKYFLSACVGYSGLTSLMGATSLKISTSNQVYQVYNNTYLSTTTGTNGSHNACVIADMDAGDTASILFSISGGASNTADILGGPSTVPTYFTGHLIY